MILKDVVDIPDYMLDSLFKFLRYSLFGAQHLNRLSCGINNVRNKVHEDSKKRKRIIDRLAKGNILQAHKRCRVPISKLCESLQTFSSDYIEMQLNILTSKVVISKPSTRSVSLMRSFSNDAQIYLKEMCTYTDLQLEELKLKTRVLLD